MNKYFLYIFLGLYVGTVFSCVLFTSYSFASSIGFSLTIRPIPECQNRIDDDGDGFIDYPADDDCSDENGTESTIDDSPTQSGSGNGTGYDLSGDDNLVMPPEDTLFTDECTGSDECIEVEYPDKEYIEEIDENSFTGDISEEDILLDSAPENISDGIGSSSPLDSGGDGETAPQNSRVTTNNQDNIFIEEDSKPVVSYGKEPHKASAAFLDKDTGFNYYLSKAIHFVLMVFKKILTFIRLPFIFLK